MLPHLLKKALETCLDFWSFKFLLPKYFESNLAFPLPVKSTQSELQTLWKQFSKNLVVRCFTKC